MQLFCHFYQKYYTGNQTNAKLKLARVPLLHLHAVQLIHLLHQKVSARCLNLCTVVMVTGKIAHVKPDRTAAYPCCHYCCFKSSKQLCIPAFDYSSQIECSTVHEWLVSNK